MTLSDQLRAVADVINRRESGTPTASTPRLLRQAADEIERLKVLTCDQTLSQCDEVIRLRARVDELERERAEQQRRGFRTLVRNLATGRVIVRKEGT